MAEASGGCIATCRPLVNIYHRNVRRSYQLNIATAMPHTMNTLESWGDWRRRSANHEADTGFVRVPQQE